MGKTLSFFPGKENCADAEAEGDGVAVAEAAASVAEPVSVTLSNPAVADEGRDDTGAKAEVEVWTRLALAEELGRLRRADSVAMELVPYVMKIGDQPNML